MSFPAKLMIVAELSANVGASPEKARSMVNAAVLAGADAVKIQAYTAESLTIDHDGPGFTIEDGIWQGRKLIDLYREAETSEEMVRDVFAYCDQLGIPCFGSVFDKHGVDLMVELEAPQIKIASFEATDIPLIRYAASKGRPLIVSTGMASEEEIAEVMDAVGNDGDVTLLHCVSSYPAKAADYNLGCMKRLATRFRTPVGLSDHSLSTTLPAIAVGIGATVIEKHLCLARNGGGPDAAFSLEPDEFRRMVEACREAHAAIQPAAVAEPHRSLRRSLYITADIPAGAEITEANVRSIRPGYGLPPKHMPEVIGRRAVADLKRGTPLAWAHLAPEARDAAGTGHRAF